MATEFIQPPYVRVANDVDVWIQDQTTPPYHSYFMTHEKDDIELISGASKGDTTLYITSGHGFTANDAVLILYGDTHYQCIATSGNTNQIMVGMPLPIDFPIEGTQIIRGNIDMAVDGSSTPITYYCKIGQDAQPVDIQHIHVFMQDNVTGDDSLYGGISALSNGTLGRYVSDIGDFNLGLFRQNAQFLHRGGTQTYTDKAGGGNFSMDFSFNLKEIYGVVIRLDNRINSYLTITINDNLTDLISHKVTATGQVTLGEV